MYRDIHEESHFIDQGNDITDVLYLGNFLSKDSADHYYESVSNITARIKAIFTVADKPFSGILPSELSPDFYCIDLNQPLTSLDSALDELQQIYIKDAVYFHHPKYVAHLNCPVVLPADSHKFRIFTSVVSHFSTQKPQHYWALAITRLSLCPMTVNSGWTRRHWSKVLRSVYHKAIFP